MVLVGVAITVVALVQSVSDEPRRYVVSGNSGEMETDILSMERPRR